jgi:CRISPR-associated endonuclease/helicase Cas3
MRDGWPELLDLPTGSGKTSALDIAIYSLAVNPTGNPRRVVLVVDRRIVVDQGADQARTLLSKLMAAKSGPLCAVANALRRLWGAAETAPPFAVAVLRGGMPMDNDWAARPDQPVLGVSTVDQVGSRLLFRGYGISPRSSPIHAGLMGRDTLLLLDEVHLAEPFAETLDQIRQYQTNTPGMPSPVRTVRMSATQRSGARAGFGLDEADHAHPVMSQRLRARKFAALDGVKVTGRDERNKCRLVAERVTDNALQMMGTDGGPRVLGVVVNRVYTAHCVADILSANSKAPPFVLVTGRMRPIDRDRHVHERLIPGAGAGRDRHSDGSLIVIATQCIEAGADLDFDAIVTECASLDSLRQRFGRVDRRGELGESRSVIVCRSDVETEEDPVYGVALRHTWAWLTSRASQGGIDFGISAMKPVLGDPDEVELLLPPRRRGPVLLPTHIEMFAQTSPPPRVDQDPALWLHGPENETSDVQVVWRTNIDVSEGALPQTVERLAACRPSTLEAVAVPIAAARRWLLAGGDESPVFPDSPMRVLHEPREAVNQGIVAIRWRGVDSEGISAADLRPGDVVVVDCARGGLSHDSFDPRSTERVRDLSARAALIGRGEAVLWLSCEMMVSQGLPAIETENMPVPGEDEPFRAFRGRVDEWLSTLTEVIPADTGWRAEEWAVFRAALTGPRRALSVVGGLHMVRARVEPAARAAFRPELHEGLATETEIAQPNAGHVTLGDHSRHVTDLVRSFAGNLGLSRGLASDLVAAARLHDVGKADPRFQRLLVGGSEVDAVMLEEPLAKSALTFTPRKWHEARRASGFPDGGRHELVSVALAKEVIPSLPDVSDPDLVLHLIASHHGWCRPFAPPVEEGPVAKIELKHDGLAIAGTTAHGQARLSSGVADRYWALCHRYGVWGLALLEAILRLADHRASEMEASGGDVTA